MLGNLFRRRAPEVPGEGHQVNPFAVNATGEHLDRSAVPAMAQLEWTGADYDTVATRPVPPRAARSWRLGSPATSATDSAPDDNEASQDLSREVHSTAQDRIGPVGGAEPQGLPDSRRAAAPWLTPAQYLAAPESITMDPDHAVAQLSASSLPDRVRGGWTGADPTRTSRFPVAFTIRPFDKGIADHPGTVAKAGQPNPLASRPPDRKRLLGGRPSAGGSADSTMQPVGNIGPNTVRAVPAPWDTRVVNPGTQAASSSHSRRWGLR